MPEPVGRASGVCFEGRAGDVLGHVYTRVCELAGRRKSSGFPVDPLVEDLSRQVLERVSE